MFLGISVSTAISDTTCSSKLVGSESYYTNDKSAFWTSFGKAAVFYGTSIYRLFEPVFFCSLSIWLFDVLAEF